MHGVLPPQGSVLGPFSHLHDLNTCIQFSETYYYFAADRKHCAVK